MVITVSSIKGGVGKSSLVLLLSNNLAARGKRVLVIDMDLNNTASLFYTLGLENIRELTERKNIMLSLAQEKAEENILHSRIPNVDIISSSLSLCNIRAIDYHVLKKCINKLDYDYIVIDTSPTYDNLVKSALFAADIILTPVQLTEFNFNMASFLMNRIEEELPEQSEKIYLIYNYWVKGLKTDGNALQSTVTKLFEKTFSNILKVRLPKTIRLDYYTNCDKKVSMKSKDVGSLALASSINELACAITGEDEVIEEF